MIVGRAASWLIGTTAGRILISVFVGAVMAAIPSAYFLGRSHEAGAGQAARAVEAEAERDAILAGIETETVRLAAAVAAAGPALEADRAWRANLTATFTAALADLGGRVDQARRAFDESYSCPAQPDDVRLYNDALGLGPDPRTGDP